MQINKQANENHLQLLLASLLGGGGIYAAGRGIKDFSNMLEKKEKDPNELSVKIPEGRFPKTAGLEGALQQYLIPAALTGGGLLAGFHGSSALYEKLKKNQIKHDLEDTEEEYLQQLAKVRDKVASINTPNLDTFFEGFFEKCAEDLEKLGFLDIFKKPELAGKEGIGDIITGQSMNVLDNFTDTEPGKLLLATMLATGLGTAGMTYSTAKKIDGRKDKEDGSGGFPNEVRLSIGRN